MAAGDRLVAGAQGLDVADTRRQRARWRRTVRASVMRAAPALAAAVTVVAIVEAIAEPEGAAFAIGLGAAVAFPALACAWLARGPARRKPEALSLALASLPVAAALALAALVRSASFVAVILVCLAILAPALFLPSRLRVHGAWLTAVLLSTVAVAAAPGSGLGASGNARVATGVIAFACLLSYLGLRERILAWEADVGRDLRGRALRRMAAYQEREMAALLGEMESASLTDPLTGCANRLRLDEDLRVTWARACRQRWDYAAVLIDIDHFKAYNDTYGHLAGDAALQAVARRLRDVTRAGDAVYRYGGEEFLVIMPGQGRDGAMAAADRLRVEVQGLAIPHEGNAPAGVVTVSVGVALADPDAYGTAEDWLREADAHLYQAKWEGRNQVVGPEPGEPHQRPADDGITVRPTTAG